MMYNTVLDSAVDGISDTRRVEHQRAGDVSHERSLDPGTKIGGLSRRDDSEERFSCTWFQSEHTWAAAARAEPRRPARLMETRFRQFELEIAGSWDACSPAAAFDPAADIVGINCNRAARLLDT